MVENFRFKIALPLGQRFPDAEVAADRRALRNLPHERVLFVPKSGPHQEDNNEKGARLGLESVSFLA